MKNKGLIITLIVILSIVVILLSCFMIVTLKGSKIFTFNIWQTKINNMVIDETYNNEFDVINIEASSGDIEIRPSLDDKINVKMYSENDSSSVNIKKSELNIKLNSKKCLGICFNEKGSKIEVYIPKDYDKKIKISSDYGDIDISYLENAIIDIEAKCGDILLQGAKEIIVNNNYGDIEIGEVSMLSVKEDAGDVKVEKVSHAKIINSKGDIEIGSVLNYVDIKSDCGDVEIDNLVISEDSIIKNDLGDIEIDNTNEIYIDAKTNLGNVNVRKNNRSAKTTLTIKNSCGDIEVND